MYTKKHSNSANFRHAAILNAVNADITSGRPNLDICRIEKFGENI